MKLSSTVVINAPAEKVWQVVAHDFAKIGEWASGVEKSVINVEAATPEGATVGGRVCSVPGFGQIRETFTEYDEAGKTFTYEATGMPFFVTSAHNGWAVQAIDANTSRVSFNLEMNVLPLVGTLMAIPMKMQLTKLLDEATEELKYYVEIGEIHPRKQALIAKSARRAPAAG
ncbi:MAG: SRPBCC family protein [Chloroflexota bacterium]